MAHTCSAFVKNPRLCVGRIWRMLTTRLFTVFTSTEIVREQRAVQISIGISKLRRRAGLLWLDRITYKSVCHGRAID